MAISNDELSKLFQAVVDIVGVDDTLHENIYECQYCGGEFAPEPGEGLCKNYNCRAHVLRTMMRDLAARNGVKLPETLTKGYQRAELD
jgi:hypothetical protein